MKRADFAFDLPEELIAQQPLPERSASRLLEVDGQSGDITHRVFTDLPALLAPGDLLIFNNTRVLPARLYAQKQTGGKAEILIERLLGDGGALAHVRASKSPREGMLLIITSAPESDLSELAVRVIGREGALYRLAPESGSIKEMMRRFGHMPLPPYIERSDTPEDRDRYQTVFGRRDGAVAAPTAGLHFDQPLLDTLKMAGVDISEVTLHVGAGTFQPVRADNIEEHIMHSEYVEVDQACCDAIARCRSQGGRVVAIGTTAVRSLETAARDGIPEPYSGDTDIFLYPGCKFNVVDAMVTNFHLPESTLIMLVSAFSGMDNIRSAYASAIENRYRFFSYGDAMFLTKQQVTS
ncbi:MAG: tRNA preQ1(34) S-adenosylmethionine ribosyltransferase-isomerase QueA [Gammaproteobacteria bacterium]|nr:tRNA preQ1(34) S-adenosylmethionine ribosyltransferase-isomerase QueA [Gammaproteobacteria bacterium]